MLFHAFLREPGTHTRSRDTKGRINALGTNIPLYYPNCYLHHICNIISYHNNIHVSVVEDLGLAQVRHTRVKDLTVSEKQRLNVACHLLLDADIVVLDRPTRGMDIFDTFFLVEYLRQWAARGRIVILTLQVFFIFHAYIYQTIFYVYHICMTYFENPLFHISATNIRNINHDLEGSFSIYWSSDVLWKEKRNVTLFCIHRLSMSCIQKSIRLLP